jgi:hypothetical protein
MAWGAMPIVIPVAIAAGPAIGWRSTGKRLQVFLLLCVVGLLSSFASRSITHNKIASRAITASRLGVDPEANFSMLGYDFRIAGPAVKKSETEVVVTYTSSNCWHRPAVFIKNGHASCQMID